MVITKCISYLIIASYSICFALDLNNLDWKTKQKYILNLFNHITEPTIYDEIKNMSNNFSIENHAELYSKMEDVRTFSAMKRKGLFDRGDVYCLFCAKQTMAAVAVFKILQGSKDFATFIITSSWLRQEINEMLFLYAFSIALRHRTDCYGLIIPPIYETYPYFYVPKKTQHDMFVALITSNDQVQRTSKDTDSKFKSDRYSMSYFTEDVGLSSFYYNFHVDYPFWMTDDVYGLNNDRRGELYIYLHNQFLARYNLEMLSNKVYGISPFNPTDIYDLTVDSTVMFHNGGTLSCTNAPFNLYKEKYELVKDLDYLENQIRDAAYTGLYNTFDGLKLDTQHKGALEALGRRIYGNSRRSNENPEHDIAYITRALFSCTLGNIKMSQFPSTTLQYYETSLRNPMFWKLQQYFLSLINRMREKKSPYRRENLYFYGVDILKIAVTRLETHFIQKRIDITNMFPNSYPDDNQRDTYFETVQLDHTPFNVTLKIYTDKQEDSIIRLYLRAAQDFATNHRDTEDHFESFVEIDAFAFKLNSGNNTIIRQSSEFNNITPLQNLTRGVRQKIESNSWNMTDYRNSFTGLPGNLILPQGSKYGLRLQMFMIVSPSQQKYLWENNVEIYKRKQLCRYTLCIDERPLGFPFDRKWEAGVEFYPNMQMIDVFVFL